MLKSTSCRSRALENALPRYASKLLRSIAAALFLAVWLASGAWAQEQAEAEVVVSKCWAYPVRDLATRMTADGSAIYTATDTAKVEAVSTNGQKLWSSELGGSIVSNIITTASGVVFVTASGKETRQLRAISKETGITMWNLPLPAAEQFYLIRSGEAIAVVGNAGTVQLIEPTGTQRWKRELGEAISAEPYFDSGRATIATTTRRIVTIDLTTGEISTSRKAVNDVTALLQLASGDVLAGDDRGGVALVNGAEKPIWRFRAGGQISKIFPAPVAGTSFVIAASHDNFIYFIRTSNGDVEWKRRLSGRVRAASVINGRHALAFGYEDRSGMLIDLTTGRPAGQVVFGPEETVMTTPISAEPASFYLLTDAALYRFSTEACSANTESGQDAKSQTAPIK